MAEEWRLESREKEKQIPPVTVREPICALVLQKWIKDRPALVLPCVSQFGEK